MQQRVQSAMQRIGELESILARDPSMRGSPIRGAGSGVNLGSMIGGSMALGVRSPLRASGVDDVRVAVKDKSRRVVTQGASFKPSPRSSSVRMGSLGLDRWVGLVPAFKKACWSDWPHLHPVMVQRANRSWSGMWHFSLLVSLVWLTYILPSFPMSYKLHACSWKEMYTTSDGGGGEALVRSRAKQMLDYDQTEVEPMDKGRDIRCATAPATILSVIL